MAQAKTLRRLKMLGTFVLMVVCGFVTFVAAATFLMNLGLKLHDNFEYYAGHPYGGYPGLFLMIGSGTIGFLAPAVVVWYLDKHSWRVSLRTLFIVITVVAVILAIYIQSL